MKFICFCPYFHILFCLFYLCLGTSCEQQGFDSVQTVNGPSYISNNQGGATGRDSRNSNNSDLTPCETHPEKLPPILGGDLQDNIESLSCSGDCSVEDTIDLELSQAEEERGFLSFPNFNYLSVGRCRGHTLVAQKFNTLGLYCHYDQKKKANCLNINSFNCRRIRRCETDDKLNAGKNCRPGNITSKCRKFYNDIIRDVNRGKFRAIPGFKSLAEFSSHSKFQKKFKDTVKAYSSTYNVKKPYLKQVFGSGQSAVFSKAKESVSKGMLPYISIKGSRLIGNHAISVYDVRQNSRGEVLCVRDSNTQRVQKNPDGIVLDKCQNYLYKKNGKVIYHLSLIHI